jgi:NAD(P)-dependent dehydrogenase (short-subunit alcohol dehydrogenase family)
MSVLLVTGSSGLIGFEVVAHFTVAGWRVFGADNNQWANFFGPQGDTRWNQRGSPSSSSGSDRFPNRYHVPGYGLSKTPERRNERRRENEIRNMGRGWTITKNTLIE